MGKILHEDLSYKIRGAMFNVYNSLGYGHKELVYQKALTREFDKLSINYKREPRLKIEYEGDQVGVYTPDFLVEEKVIVELKAARTFPVNLDRQLVNYLKATGYELALAVNFGQSRLGIRRRIWTRKSASAKSVPKSV
jgi:GxxExxY protein